ncbi:MAG: TolC family protein, partial [Campylobacterales bacterium]|nr:TolC family protein [Campylobacterales bacterium]
NDVEDILTQYESEYSEISNRYEASLGGVSSYGTQWNVKISQNTKDSSLIEKNGAPTEHAHNIELSFKQPLLKGFGEEATLVKIDIAKLEYDKGVSEFKKNLMDLVGITIQYYWKLYGIQEIYKSWEESLEVAKKQLRDVELKVKSGKAARTDLLTIKSAIAQRNIELESTKSKMVEIEQQILTLLNIPASTAKNIRFELTTKPDEDDITVPTLEESFKESLAYWPEFKKMESELKLADIKVNYAQSQIKPQLDITANVNTSSMDKTTAESFHTVITDEYLSWYAGFEFSIPLDNTYAKNNLDIERLNRLQAQKFIESLSLRLNNELSIKIEQLKSAIKQMQEYDSGIVLQRSILEAEFIKLEYGKIALKDLLEEQDKYISFQRKLLNNMVELKISNAILQKATGKLLDRFNIVLDDSIDLEM